MRSSALPPRCIAPRNRRELKDRTFRNGVCITRRTQFHFVLTKGLVNFHNFALFSAIASAVGMPLFLGAASGVYAPGLGRNDAPGHGGYGPIIAVVE